MTNQKIDAWGRVILTESGLLELFYRGIDHPVDLLAENSASILEYNQWCKTFDKTEKVLPVFSPLPISPEEYHQEQQATWLMPEQYKNLDIESWLRAKCASQEQLDRVDAELALFNEHLMADVLRLLVYITETLREQNVCWGVGRGSSVASYVLFLIGVHRIDSLKYDLDIREFLKEN
jgi:DNA polymerase III alpha subunit